MATSVSAKSVADVDLMYLLAQANHVLTAKVAAALAGIGISQRTYCVLSKAMTAEFTQIRLAELVLLDKTTMVVTLDELEKAGLAERRPSSTDRRARIVAVTEAGRRKVAEADEIVNRLLDDVLSALPVRERQALVDGLYRLVTGPLAEPPHCQETPRRPRGSRSV